MRFFHAKIGSVGRGIVEIHDGPVCFHVGFARLSAKLVQTAISQIEAASHRQAMDWALVLASQGIECAIDQRPDDFVWVLQLPAESAVRATDAIRAYEKENATVWRREVKWTGLLFDWRSFFWWLLMAAIFWVANSVRPDLEPAGVMRPELWMKGQWWRAFTAVTLHADLAHLALNLSTGFALLGLAMGFYGPGMALLASFTAGAAANVAEMFLRTEHYSSLGASGMVMAALGMIAAQSLFERHHSAREWVGRGVLAAGLLVVLIGLDTKSDVLAHLLGFGFGTLFGVLLCFFARKMLRRKWIDNSAAVLCAALVFVTWLLAIRYK